jgi:glycosyltransferase involved in cell wall biosynthesis
MPTVSVIIPAYNGVSRFLEQAITSVQGQTYQDFELIVVDDASTDETAQLVKRFPHARYFRRHSNGGQASARNDGARLATGDYLAFLDQDDLWEASLLREALPALQAEPTAAVIHSDGYQVNERNEILEYDAAMKPTFSVTQLLRGDHDVATSGSIFRKACFNIIGGYDEQLAIWEDIDLAIRLFQRFPILHLARPLYRHRLYTRNVSREISSARALQGRRRFLDKHGPSCPSGTKRARALARDWSHYYRDLGKHHWREGDVAAARRAFRLSLRHRPFDPRGILKLLQSYLLSGAPAQSVPPPRAP